MTDIERSTQLVASMAEEYPSLLAEHRRVIHEEIGRHGGHQVDCRGDEVFAVFTEAGPAVETALAFQAALAAHPTLSAAPLRVRAGIHTGEPGLDSGGYYGLDVHRAARIASAGHGGQVLISEPTRVAALEGGTSFELRDLGRQSLRGLPRPEHLWQLVVPGLPADFPTLRHREQDARRMDGPGKRIRVVVADDSLLLREGVARVLDECGFEVIGQAASPEELLAEIASVKPDAAIVDIRMPPTHTDEGIRAAREIRRESPDVGVLVLSQFAEPTYALDLLADGARGVGYLLKDRVSDMLDFGAAVRRVSEGGSALDGEVVKLLVARARRDGPLAGLSEIDVELVQFVAEGRSTREIADRLVLDSEEQAATRIDEVLARLGLADVAGEERVAALLTGLAPTRD
jgi:DNA-binding NarL/FixJ family response regulator/class 3 adenylate cyclase